MVFDPVKHEKNRVKFLVSLYEIEQEDCAGKPIQEVRHERVVGERAGLTEVEWDRISSELLDDGLIEGVAMGGLVCNLTRDGQEFVEKKFYEKTLLAKRRKAIEWVKEGGIFIGKKTAIALGSLFTGLSIFAAFKEQIIQWLNHQLGQ